MWLAIFFVGSLFITIGLACNGCKFDPEVFSVTPCSDTAHLIDLECESPELTDTCEMKTNCRKNIKMPVESVQVEITGHIGKIPIHWNVTDLCEALKQKTFDGKNVQDFFTMFSYLPDSCQKSREADVKKTITLTKDMRNSLAKGEGKTEMEIKFSNVNGVAGQSDCWKFTSQLNCYQKRVNKHS